MLVQIQDRAAFLSLSITSLRAYLLSKNWADQGNWGERPISIFVKEHGGRTWEILVPHRDTIGGYVENMATSVEILATVEERSQLEVFADLSAAGADVIRVHSTNGRATEALSLRQSTALYDNTYAMVVSAARAAGKPQATYRGPLSSDIADYLDGVKPVQGHHHGYNLTLHSHVPADFGTQIDMGDDYSPPFPRRATLMLAEALKHSKQAISGALSDDHLESFRQAVSHGVSANLCDAVANLAKEGKGIEIDLLWAPVRSSSIENQQFQFSVQSVDVLVEAAKSFRRDEPSFDESIVAQVIKLAREPKDFDATLLYVSENYPVRVHVQFEESSYSVVINAYETRNLISLDGDIYRTGNGYELRNPRNISPVEVGSE